MLVECGFLRVTTGEGVEYSFTPSFSRIAALGTPHEIVALFSGLYGPNAAQDAAYVLACLCDQEDPTPLIGGRAIRAAPAQAKRRWWQARACATAPGVEVEQVVPPTMPLAIQITLAQHLMLHGLVGTAKPENKGDGKFSDKFDVSEYVAAARVHLGLSSADAEALSMTEFQRMFEMKFPRPERETDAPSIDEYEAAERADKERRRVN